MTGGTRGTIVEVASSPSLRRTDQCDGMRQILLHLLYRFLSISL
jgi:hypothetical protein